ncbi:hypothetical protein JTB14_022565 [Gonioctena quinquepunctata]|nr:hypothetical protein JTB14_022565 [Gonioctena quinquepunctata]
MNTFILLSLLVWSCNSDSIQQQVEKIIDQLKNELPEPINIPKASIILPESKYISGLLNLNDLRVTGPKALELKVQFILLGTLPTGFTFYLKDLKINTKYFMEIPLFNSPLLTLFGNGDTSITLSNLSINSSISITSLPNIFTKLKLSLADAKFNITNFLNDPDFSEELSEDLTKGIVPTIENNNEAISSLVENLLNFVVRSVLEPNKTLAVVSSSKTITSDRVADEGSIDIIELLNIFKIWIGDFLILYA